MLRKILLAMAGIVLLSNSLPAAELRLSKSLFGLDDLFYSYRQSSTQTMDAGKGNSTELVSSLYRDAIQYELKSDTLWVKVFITIEPTSGSAATTEFKAMKLRALSQFGNIYAAQIDLRQLPTLDQLPFVERIEPVAPDGSSARASTTTAHEDSPVKKK